jgi:hypothetical protein
MSKQDLKLLVAEVRKSAAKAAQFQLQELHRFKAQDIVLCRPTNRSLAGR